MTDADQIPVGPCSPFLIVSDVASSLGFYADVLGFECRYRNSDKDPFFAICGQDSAQIMLKAVGDGVGPLPNPQRHKDARWDVFIYAPKPDELAKAYAKRGVVFSKPLAPSSDGLLGFEITDPDGYVCYFGCPINQGIT